ncbi:MAG: aminoacyl-tRNA hydrolase [Oscillospiraceae bacterium]|nr:aminoacyl-tRNA hydrolase [Oscillospiraceae bacterium]
MFWKSRIKQVVVGLGNPGISYDGTRHNLGFCIVDEMAKRQGVKIDRKKFDGAYVKVALNGVDIALLKPLTYVNNSGIVVRAFTRYFKVKPKDVIVVQDDITLEPGLFKIKVGGSDGGHNGIKSVGDFLDEDNFIRVKCGVGTKKNKNMELADWVLTRFDAGEKGKIEAMIPRVLECLECIVKDGVSQAMNKYN